MTEKLQQKTSALVEKIAIFIFILTVLGVLADLLFLTDLLVGKPWWLVSLIARIATLAVFGNLVAAVSYLGTAVIRFKHPPARNQAFTRSLIHFGCLILLYICFFWDAIASLVAERR